MPLSQLLRKLAGRDSPRPGQTPVALGDWPRDSEVRLALSNNFRVQTQLGYRQRLCTAQPLRCCINLQLWQDNVALLQSISMSDSVCRLS